MLNREVTMMRNNIIKAEEGDMEPVQAEEKPKPAAKKPAAKKPAAKKTTKKAE